MDSGQMVRACELLLRERDSKICYDRYSKLIYRKEGVSNALFYRIAAHLALIVKSITASNYCRTTHCSVSMRSLRPFLIRAPGTDYAMNWPICSPAWSQVCSVTQTRRWPLRSGVVTNTLCLNGCLDRVASCALPIPCTANSSPA